MQAMQRAVLKIIITKKKGGGIWCFFSSLLVCTAWVGTGCLCVRKEAFGRYQGF